MSRSKKSAAAAVGGSPGHMSSSSSSSLAAPLPSPAASGRLGDSDTTSYLLPGIDVSAVDGTRERSFMRIFVSTDNHLGYMERDPVRCEDSFAAFEEVLASAANYHADFILLAGDLFHENKPSRRTLYQTMALLRKYCYGSDPIYTEVLNDQSKNLKSNNGCANFLDPFQSVSMPIFAIHGNHDDPSRDGSHSEALAALDLLAVNNALNYFGKADRVDDIEIVPILLKKDSNYVALYGLGAIRDERLNRMWTEKKVKFVRPKQEEGAPSFFNIFIIHQNRDYGRGKKNCIQESMIPEWMDMVIWGNEHECHVNPQETLTGPFRIYQPGSSIATSLVETESCACPKHYGILDVKGAQYRLTPRKYQQMRPFIYRNISLDTDHETSTTKYGEIFNPKDPKVEDKVKVYLKQVIDNMMLDTQDMVSDLVENSSSDQQAHHVKDPHLVLLRLKVEKSDALPAVNIQRFGAQFVGACANPSEILLFANKKREIENAASSRKPSASAAHHHHDDDENVNQVIRIEELVSANLQNSSKNLSVLPEAEMALALEDYVKRKHANAFLDAVRETLESTQAELFRNRDGYTSSSTSVDPLKSGAALIADAAKRVKDRTEEKIKKGEKIREERKISDFVLSDDENNGMDYDRGSDDDTAGAKKTTKAKASAKSTGAKASGGGGGVDESPVRGGRGSRGGGRGGATTAAAGGRGAGARGSTAAGRAATSKSKKSSMLSDEDSDGDSAGDLDDIQAKPVRQSGRAQAKPVTYLVDSDDEINDGDSISDDQFAAPKGKASSSSSAAGGRGNSNSNSNSNSAKPVVAPTKSSNALGFPSQLLPSQGIGSSDNSLFAPSNLSASQASSSGRRQLPSSFTAPTAKGKKKSDDW